MNDLFVPTIPSDQYNPNSNINISDINDVFDFTKK
jgi:hypothetical protein